MKNWIALTKPIFEWLIEHLVFIEENADDLACFYYPDLPEEQGNMIKFFKGYVSKIEKELERIEVVDSIESYRRYDNLNEFSFVIIGSQVEVSGLTGGDMTSFKLIHPVEHGKRRNEITYLSPMGRALLLREAGSEFEVEMPSGLQQYRINSVRLL